MKYFLIFLTFLVIDCQDAEDKVTQEVEKKALEELADEIRAIADESVCSAEYSCDFIGFGSKPCGGHWSYLVYSNSIDVVEFIARVKAYNILEEEYNKKWDVFSDCMAVMPPSATTCENGKCKPVYN
ncbi:MAG: hypothetical protein ABFR05_05450 [Bacteroidota bacterium]